MGIILGIETSCDDTGISVCKDGVILSNVYSSQLIHSSWGGVVPDLAAREHVQVIQSITERAILEAEIEIGQISAIAYTRGPGLKGSLLVGSNYAKGLSIGLGVPLIDIHHMQAHVLAHFIDLPVPSFPFLCLTVSGGHTQILLVRDYFDMEVIGLSIDDAAGEAYDKIAKMLGLTYPGGPAIQENSIGGNESRFSFPFPAIPGLDMSFSGLKTSVLYFIRDEVSKDPDFVSKHLSDLCASIQYRINSILLSKVSKAVSTTGIREVAIAGGVSANKHLRSLFEMEAKSKNWNVYIPQFQYCTDNGAMIAFAGYLAFERELFGNIEDGVLPRWPIQGKQHKRDSKSIPITKNKPAG